MQFFPSLAERAVAGGVLAGIEEIDVFLVLWGIFDDWLLHGMVEVRSVELTVT